MSDRSKKEVVVETEEDKITIGFANLGLDKKLLEQLTALGYEEPTPIQSEAIPPLIAGKDILGQAATGTGKTAAFALPILQRCLTPRVKKGKGPRAVVLVPTRELCMQVAEATHRYGRTLGVVVLPIYGGQSYEQQLRGLHRGVDVVVATPGRLLDHLRGKSIDLSGVEMAILDEADEMLDMGFLEDIEGILKEMPETRQMALISATLPPRVAGIAKRHLKDPTRIKIQEKALAEGDVPRVRQTVYVVPRARKVQALARLMDVENPGGAIVFCRTRHEVDELAIKLGAQGHRVEALHGGMSQQQRERVLQKLKGANADIVIATDVAARGLDIERLTHVINFDVPSAPEAYVHRIGRVGRAGREGVAITLAEPRERRLIHNIEMMTRQRMEVANIPTLADLQARRLEMTRSTLREILIEGGLERFRDTIETLVEDFELIDIAMAALKLVHKDDPVETEDDKRAAVQADRASVPMQRLLINVGRIAGVRPQDLVGAITNEADIAGRDIGAIQISDRFSLVELRADQVDRVIAAMSATTIKGQQVQMRLDTQRPGQDVTDFSDSGAGGDRPARGGFQGRGGPSSSAGGGGGAGGGSRPYGQRTAGKGKPPRRR